MAPCSAVVVRGVRTSVHANPVLWLRRCLGDCHASRDVWLGLRGVASGASRAGLRRMRLRLPATLPCVPRLFWRQLRISGDTRSYWPLRRPALASGAGLLRNLTITYPLLCCSSDLPLLRARGLSRGLTFPVHHLAAPAACPCFGRGVSHGICPFPDHYLAAPAACPSLGRGSHAGFDHCLTIT